MSDFKFIKASIVNGIKEEVIVSFIFKEGGIRKTTYFTATSEYAAKSLLKALEKNNGQQRI